MSRNAPQRTRSFRVKLSDQEAKRLRLIRAHTDLPIGEQVRRFFDELFTSLGLDESDLIKRPKPKARSSK